MTTTRRHFLLLSGAAAFLLATSALVPAWSQSSQAQWVVEGTGGAMKVVDVVAEGTSLRLTQRSDYASFLSRHGDSIPELLSALQRQLDNAG